MRGLIKGLVALSLPVLLVPTTVLFGDHSLAGAPRQATAASSSTLAGVPGPDASAALAVVSAESGILPPKNPTRSLAPSPNYRTSADCIGVAHRNSKLCNALVLEAITHARSALEHMKAMSFSLKAYDKLPRIEQLFVTVNLERIERGLNPATELVPSLDTAAQAGAATDSDPSLSLVGKLLPGGAEVIGATSNWAGGSYNPLGSDYSWMYDDGYPSRNLACSSPTAKGCWGHRDNILGGASRYGDKFSCPGRRYQLVMGAGYVGTDTRYGESEAELIGAICGPTPKPVVTWATLETLLNAR